MMFIGGVITGAASGPHIHAAGFVLVIGFDKMFNVFSLSLRLRQRIIPRQDLGKTTGLVAMMNNLSQPLAGLIVTVFAGVYGAVGIVAALSLFMGVVGLLAGAFWLRRARVEAIAD